MTLDHPERMQEEADEREDRSARRVVLCVGLALAALLIGGAIGWWR